MPVPTGALQDIQGTKIADILASRSLFIALQALDLATTLIAFHFGAFEANPVVGRLTTTFGRTGGVLFSKVIAVLVIFRVRKLMWFANLFYLGVVCWNTFLLVAIWHVMHRLRVLERLLLRTDSLRCGKSLQRGDAMKLVLKLDVCCYWFGGTSSLTDSREGEVDI